MNRHFKVEGNIIFPDKTIMTWGPFYYYSFDNAKSRMNNILKDIVSWCNLQNPTLNIKPKDLINTSDGKQVIFKIRAWKDENTLEECNGIICVKEIVFEETKIKIINGLQKVKN